MSLGSGEILLCLFVALVVLGPEQLPKAARDVGRALAELRKLNSAVQGQINDFIKVDDDTMPATDRKATAYTPPSGGRHFSSDSTTDPVAKAPDSGEFRQVDEVLETRPYAPPPADEDPLPAPQPSPSKPPE